MSAIILVHDPQWTYALHADGVARWRRQRSVEPDSEVLCLTNYLPDHARAYWCRVHPDQCGAAA